MVFLTVYSLVYIADYNNSKRDIESNINELFKISSQSFHDSIRIIKDIYLYYVYDSKHINKRLYMCGDFINEAKVNEGLMAPRVAIVANHEANTVVRLLLNEEEV